MTNVSNLIDFVKLRDVDPRACNIERHTKTGKGRNKHSLSEDSPWKILLE